MQYRADTVAYADRTAQRLGIEGPAVSIEMIAAIFGRVLRFSPIEADSDFFELGGDSIMATALAMEIEAELGVKLPVATLFDTRTPATLARALAVLAVPSGGPAVQRKAGTAAASVTPSAFLVPGANGWAITLASFARRLDIPIPIYGMQAPGLDGEEPPLSRVEHMAERYLSAIRSVQPHGPYLVGGYSMGGLTALHLAQMLVSAGECVALLVLFDSTLRPSRSGWGARFGIWRWRARHHATIPRGKRWSEALPYALARTRGLLNDVGTVSGPSPDGPRQTDIMLTPAALAVIEGGRAAAAAYRPSFYPRTITFFRARDDNDSHAYPEIAWRGRWSCTASAATMTTCWQCAARMPHSHSRDASEGRWRRRKRPLRGQSRITRCNELSRRGIRPDQGGRDRAPGLKEFVHVIFVRNQ